MSCDRNLDEVANENPLYFAPPLGGVLCADCRPASSDSFLLPPGVLAALQSLVVRPVREASVQGRLEESVRRVVSSHILAHAPGNTVLAAPDRSRSLRLA